MKLLIKQACITDPLSPDHGKIQDILIEQGIIRDISSSIQTEADQVVDAQDGMQVSPGWVEIFSNFADPGFEFKETLETGSAPAAPAGFPNSFLTPDTHPVPDNKSQLEFIRRRSSGLPVNLWPIGAITRAM